MDRKVDRKRDWVRNLTCAEARFRSGRADCELGREGTFISHLTRQVFRSLINFYNRFYEQLWQIKIMLTLLDYLATECKLLHSLWWIFGDSKIFSVELNFI